MSSPHSAPSTVCLAPKCDRPTHGAFICVTCFDMLKRDLRGVEDLWAELEITRTRQANITRDRVGARSTTKPLPWNEHAAQIATELHSTLNAWALDLDQRGGIDDRDPLSLVTTEPADVAAWLLRNITAFQRNEEAGQAVDEIGDAIVRARRAIDLPPDKVFAGPCGARLDDEQDCDEDLYGRPGKLRCWCMSCGAEHDMEKRREWMLSVVEDQVTHSGLLSGLVTSLGVPIASSTIRHYASRGRIKVISTDARRRPMYRIGDVLDVFLKRAA